MYRFLLSPRWLALHTATVVVVIAFVILGWWQFTTFQLVDDRQRRLDQEPVAINELASPGQPVTADATGRRVTVRGHYASDDQVLVANRVHDRIAGSYVLTPLRTPDGTTVPVLRGWIDRPDDPAEEPASGPVTVTGVLVEQEPAEAAAVGASQVDPGEIAYIASEPLVAATGLDPDSLYGGFVLLTDEQPAAAAAPERLPAESVVPGRGTSPWQNLSYWAQWWVFAGAALAFWASFVRSAVRERRRPPNNPAVPADQDRASASSS